MTTLTERAWAEAAERDRDVGAAQRRARGIVHTPPEVARFVARSAVDLARRLGLAPIGLSVIDPAIGTGIFPAAVLEVAPEAVGGLAGYDVDAGALARTRRTLGESAVLVERSALECLPLCAGVPLVIGNPPWAGKSTSRGTPASEGMLEDFRRDERGLPLREKKIGVLSDDYVRFVRWSVEVLRRAPHGGVLGLVVSSSWLDGPVHRGMRSALLRWLDEIVIVDLGGSALVARSRGARDENVFGVRPGACVLLGGRSLSSGAGGADAPRSSAARTRRARARYARLAGSREEKLAALDRATAEELPLEPLAARPPGCFFVPRVAPSEAYELAPSITDWMPFHREGLQTNRDPFAIDRDRAALEARLLAFAAGTLPAGDAPPPTAHFDPERARRRLAAAIEAAGSVSGLVRRCAYRPFDDRFYVADPSVCHRPRPELAAAVETSGLVLLTTRKDRGEAPFRHLALVRSMPDSSFLSARSSVRTRAFPSHGPDGAPNLGPVGTDLRARLGGEPAPGAVVAYVAAFLGAPSYQARFDASLRADFPRVPLPGHRTSFERIAAAGEALARAWLDDPPDGVPHPRARTLIVGHVSIVAAATSRGDAEGLALRRASAIARAEDAADVAIATELAAL